MDCDSSIIFCSFFNFGNCYTRYVETFFKLFIIQYRTNQICFKGYFICLNNLWSLIFCFVGNSKRLSSQNARKLLSKWCEGLVGKPVKKEKVAASSYPSTKKLNVTCPNCGKFYKWYSSLKNHLRLECGKDPQYFCQLCKYSTHYPQDYKKHMIRVHKFTQEVVAKSLAAVANTGSRVQTFYFKRTIHTSASVSFSFTLLLLNKFTLYLFFYLEYLCNL